MTTPAVQGTTVPLHPAHQGIRATLIGIGINVLLAVAKLLAGIFGHSYALIADAVESITDVFSSLLVYAGLKVAIKPPDENHPYGHGKAEPLAAVAVALFLFFAAINIAFQSFREIRTPHTVPAAWTLLVVVGVVCIKGMLFKFVARVGEEVGSSALKGDAFHHVSDALTSAAAFIGISVALIGSRMAPDPRWSSADDWAALFASLIIAYNGWGVLKHAVLELTDTRISTDIEEEARKVALAIPGVVNLDKCIARKMGFDYYVELDVRVERTMPVYQSHDIAHAVQDAIREQVTIGKVARVIVHIEPTLPEYAPSV